jgi:AraC-like DNA-binding protein
VPEKLHAQLRRLPCRTLPHPPETRLLVAPLRQIPPETLRPLASYADLVRQMPALENPELRELVEHVRDLMALALGAAGDGAASDGSTQSAKGGGMRAARLRAIKADILANLGTHNLSLDAVAERQGISPIYVRKLFEGEDTSFTRFVLRERLARAHQRLSDPLFAEHTIATLAFEAGFGDLSYFNRAFRRRFGTSPSDVRAATRRVAGSTPVRPAAPRAQ